MCRYTEKKPPGTLRSLKINWVRRCSPVANLLSSFDKLLHIGLLTLACWHSDHSVRTPDQFRLWQTQLLLGPDFCNLSEDQHQFGHVDKRRKAGVHAVARPFGLDLHTRDLTRKVCRPSIKAVDVQFSQSFLLEVGLHDEHLPNRVADRGSR